MPYVSPRDVEDPASCHFYHCIELPGLGLTEGHWDLRGVVDDYLGGLAFAGQRVLDIGTASGFLTFEMERRGADVVSFDIADGKLPDMVPYAQPTFDAAAVAAATHKRLDRLKNGYWLAHRLLESKARVVYGDVQALPTEIGHLDIALFGMILGHLRDPFGALHSATQLKPATIVITNQTHPDDVGAEPYAHFMPAPTNSEAMAWWGLSIGCLRQMLDVLDYDVVDVRSLWPTCAGVPGRQGSEHCSSIVARRR